MHAITYVYVQQVLLTLIRNQDQKCKLLVHFKSVTLAAGF